MGDALRKAVRGETLHIPATAYNAFIDAAEDLARRRANQIQDAASGHRSSGIILVKNISGSPRARFDVLGITTPVVLPTANLDQFKNRIVLNGMTPDADHADAFAILQEPLGNSAIGPALVVGVSVVQCYINDTDHQYAQAKAGDVTQLESADSGIARILWSPGSTGKQWAVVRVAEALPPKSMVPVTVTKDGGVAGSASPAVTCSFTYTIKDLAGATLATGLTPLRPRYSNVTYVQPADGSYGLAFKDAAGDWQLYEAVEERPLPQYTCA